jgi:hypothetical protein
MCDTAKPTEEQKEIERLKRLVVAYQLENARLRELIRIEHFESLD